MSSGKKILITGGAGFIGANLVRALAENQQNKIHILVEKNSNLWRLSDIVHNIVVHEISLIDFEHIRNLVLSIKPNTIFHLAAYGGMPNQQEQKMIYDVNFYGTINLLNACKEVGFDCFINTGSSSEYGIKNEVLSEQLVLEPVSDYAVAKAAATQFCTKEALFHKLPVYTIRPFSVYGDYEMPTRLIPTVLVKTLLGEPIHLSSPHYVRDYIYIKDMVNLYLEVAEQKPKNFFVFNGGTGIQSSIQDVVNTVQELCPHPSAIVWGSSTPRPWEPTTWQADITQPQEILNWQPEYNLARGLQASLEFFKKNISFYIKGTKRDVQHISKKTDQHISAS